ncbi:RteC domain-containing protein [Aureibaculum sp. 2210JD6-5]|uniref:RteC domain-containing protein n=1 Tax=Aureibaculum sp. 2210JD6-5 TaxID=3103957 RepID=UPI002AADBC0A|nr:RteC domain-containing protein [Aureibaculum sp. 2210JD6-5]MDY7397030.1 RteC domain-containing protein [Aureibaculum sp. 2210JD6-5]
MLYSEIIIKFKEQLIAIKKNFPKHLDQANIGCILCTKTLSKLQKFIEKNGFKNSDLEIHFFKNEKVLPMSNLIYYTELRSCELRLPKIGKEEQKDFLQNQIYKVNQFFDKNTDFNFYMEQGLIHFDKYYFTRKYAENGLLVKSYPYYKNPTFSTSHDGVWARLRGMLLYAEYLQNKIEFSDIVIGAKNDLDLVWTGSYAAFVEMIYGLQALGYFNNGNKDLNQIIEVLGNFLNVPTGNSSRTYNELKSRKSSRIKFFEEAGQKLLKKMDDEDAF